MEKKAGLGTEIFGMVESFHIGQKLDYGKCHGMNRQLKGQVILATADFFQDVDLSKLSEEGWESLCTHCGVCCLHKIEDVETGDIYTTRVLCEFYDLKSGGCSVYDQRFQL